VLTFLRAKGFAEAEIQRQPTRTVDKLAREYGQPQPTDRLRYVVTTSVIVRTPSVDLVRAALGSTEELLKSGVVLDGEREGAANPRYVVSRFNDLRPQLLAEATRNARATASSSRRIRGRRSGSSAPPTRARSRSSASTAATSRRPSARPAPR